MSRERLVKKARGMLFGLAIGDALGYPVEFWKREQIFARLGPQGVVGPMPGRPFLFSDDTQMSLCVLRAILEAGDAPLEEFMAVLSREFIRWKNSPENNRAPGRTCTAGVKNLERGVSWRESGLNSKGCGSVMRVAPIGFYYAHNLDLLRERAHWSGVITHRHPAADAACIAGAYACALGLQEVPVEEYLPRIRQFVKGISSEFDAKLGEVERLLEEKIDPSEGVEALGEGWVGEEAFCQGLYCFLSYPEDYPKAVLNGANTRGDSDSIACIAGYLSGVRLGIDAIPPEWQEQIEKRDLLWEYGQKLGELTFWRSSPSEDL